MLRNARHLSVLLLAAFASGFLGPVASAQTSGAIPAPAPATIAPGQLVPARSLCPGYYDEMLAKGKAVRTSEKGLPVLLPKDGSAAAIRDAFAAEKPGILVETVFVLARSAPPDAAARARELAGILGLLRSFTSLEGIQYYSASHGSMQTLYAESYRIDAPDTRLRLDDPPAPAPSAAFPEETLYAFQRDLSFGANVYRYVFRSLADAASAEITNLTRMHYGIIPLVGPEGLKMRLLVVQASDGIVFYVASGSASAGIFRARLQESFSNRATALFNWFTAHKSAYLAP
jgi:hypothetical protein